LGVLFRNRIYQPEKLLDELRSDATNSPNKDDRLDAVYQRLWDINGGSGFGELRDRLFHLVLASFGPLRPTELEQALRIGPDYYNMSLRAEDVQDLYANFLTVDSNEEFRFVHDSARKFVVNIRTNASSPSQSEIGLAFANKRSHASIADLYRTIMEDTGHPYWSSQRLDPSGSRASPVIRQARDIPHFGSFGIFFIRKLSESRHSYPIHCYLFIYGLRHFAQCAAKQSLVDETWRRVINMILSPKSGFPWCAVQLREFYTPPLGPPFMPNAKFFWFLREHNGQLEVIYSHLLATLNIISDEDLSMLELECQRSSFQVLDRLAGEFPEQQSNGGIKWRPHRRWRPLDIACHHRNSASLRFMLQGGAAIYGPKRMANVILHDRTNPVLTIAVTQKDVISAKALLELEKDCCAVSSPDVNQNNKHENPRHFQSQQWCTGGLGAAGRSISAFGLANKTLNEGD
jgi:hypothetical protein